MREAVYIYFNHIINILCFCSSITNWTTLTDDFVNEHTFFSSEIHIYSKPENDSSHRYMLVMEALYYIFFGSFFILISLSRNFTWNDEFGTVSSMLYMNIFVPNSSFQVNFLDKLIKIKMYQKIFSIAFLWQAYIYAMNHFLLKTEMLNEKQNTRPKNINWLLTTYKDRSQCAQYNI